MDRVPPLSLFELSPITRALIEHMRQVPINDIVSYADLSQVACGDVQNGAFHLMHSARTSLRKERIVFGTVPTVGLKRLDDSGALDATESHLGRAYNATKRAAETVRACRLTALPPEERGRYHITLLRVGLARQFTSSRIGQRVARLVGAGVEAGQFPRLKAALKDTLRQFGQAE